MATFTPSIKRDRSLHNGYTVVARRETFGERLRRLRLDHDWSQADLAERANSDDTAISLYERGQRLPNGPTLCRLARAFGICPAELWSGTPCGGVL